MFLLIKDRKVWYMTKDNINCIEWLKRPSKTDMDHLDIRKHAPEQALVKSYVIDGQHCPISFKNSINDSKLTEAILHPNGKSVTIAFHNFGTFTYLLKEKSSLEDGLRNWNGLQNQRPFGCQLQLNG